ncbi:hypothetical protein Tco_1389941, partial [Tanacetum coccineum]
RDDCGDVDVGGEMMTMRLRGVKVWQPLRRRWIWWFEGGVVGGDFDGVGWWPEGVWCTSGWSRDGSWLDRAGGGVMRWRPELARIWPDPVTAPEYEIEYLVEVEMEDE